MTLDLSRIVDQLNTMTEQRRDGVDAAREEALRAAFGGLRDDELRARLADARTSWLLAKTEADFRARVPAEVISGDFAVVASDGSFIMPDRHSPVRFYLINIGKVMLRYGEHPDAELTAEPRLYFEEHELFVPNAVRKIPVNGAVLGLKRAAEELKAVADRAIGLSCPTLALQDGTLILWALESQPDFVVSWVLDPFLETLDRLRDGGVPIAAFISYPGSNDLMNTLRVSICDYPDQGRRVDCDHCRGRIGTEGHVPACDILPDVTDRHLFEHIAALQPGERSQVFASTSKILTRYGPDHHIHFFYLHTGTEVGRVEIPRWVAEDADLLTRTQAILVDQCRRGRGYPSALQEAHEMAVIRTAERREVELMIDEALARHGIMLPRSGKDGSKRGRFV